MRDLAINKRSLYYALYKGTKDILNSDGYKTGEKEVEYNSPVEFNVNQSGGRGAMENDLFGANVIYSLTLVTTDMTCPIDEYSVVWIGKDPTKDPYNYVVAAKPIKTINSITIALREVDVKNAQNA